MSLPSRSIQSRSVEHAGRDLDSLQIQNLDDSDQTRVPGQEASPMQGKQRESSSQPENSSIDPPSNGDLDLRKWLQDAVRETDTNSLSRRHTGFSFTDLNVFGFDAGQGVQSTIWSVALDPFRTLASVLSSKASSRVHILRDCNGFLKDGEMLLVLGRPGSGCSTFLKQ